MAADREKPFGITFSHSATDSPPVVYNPNTPEEVKWGPWKKKPDRTLVPAEYVMIVRGRPYVPAAMIFEPRSDVLAVGKMPKLNTPPKAATILKR